MRAWIVREHGGPEVLRLEDLPSPKPQAGEARIRVRAVGLNHLDLWVRKGVTGHHFPLPLIPGCDVVGAVESFGPLSDTLRSRLDAAGIREGSRVLVDPMVSCGACARCARGRPELCVRFGLVGETRDGGLAEELVVPASNLIALPPSLGDEQAASLPIAYVTAWSMVDTKADLSPGDWVLVQAGGSGVSAAAIQMAKLKGATVITTVGSPDKADKAKALGADHVIPYHEQDFVQEVRRLAKAAGRRGVDVALDHVGAETFAGTLKCLEWGGKLITCGATSGSEVTLDLKPIFFKSLSILGSTMGNRADLLRVVELVSSGRLETVVDSVHAFADVPEAFARLESRAVFGKIVVRA